MAKATQKAKRRALVSVSDKTGVVEFCKELEKLDFEIVSTGGTLKALLDAGVKAISITDVTGFRECLDGRVKTLHPAVHAGLLARRDIPEHMEQLREMGYGTIDLVAVNLYPFKATIQKPNVTLEEAIENIDIGGPTMLRSAAKNYGGVIVVCEPSDYAEVLKRLKDGTDGDQKFRLGLSYKVYRHTAAYDSLISSYMQKLLGEEFPEHISFAYDKAQELRYGENPHQGAAFYREQITPLSSLACAEQIQGKELSYNNINDANGAIELLREFDEPTVVASKHTNPCGVATAENIYDAYVRAYECDPVSIFGGIVACNRTVDKRTAEEMVKIFLEIVIAPDFTQDALEVFTKKKNLRILRLPHISDRPVSEYDFKRVHGGLLVQHKDLSLFDPAEVKVVTKRAPTKEETASLEFAYKVVKHTKSNAIVVANGLTACGVGPGQTNRIWATEQAIERAGDKAHGGVLASDAFFPFDDCVKAAAKAGITAIIQPGGSIRDEDSIKACDEAGIAMIFVGQRHFKH